MQDTILNTLVIPSFIWTMDEWLLDVSIILSPIPPATSANFYYTYLRKQVMHNNITRTAYLAGINFRRKFITLRWFWALRASIKVMIVPLNSISLINSNGSIVTTTSSIAMVAVPLMDRSYACWLKDIKPISTYPTACRAKHMQIW